LQTEDRNQVSRINKILFEMKKALGWEKRAGLDRLAEDTNPRDSFAASEAFQQLEVKRLSAKSARSWSEKLALFTRLF
jgi:hypothetical protein